MVQYLDMNVVYKPSISSLLEHVGAELTSVQTSRYLHHVPSPLPFPPADLAILSHFLPPLQRNVTPPSAPNLL